MSLETMTPECLRLMSNRAALVAAELETLISAIIVCRPEMTYSEAVDIINGRAAISTEDPISIAKRLLAEVCYA